MPHNVPLHRYLARFQFLSSFQDGAQICNMREGFIDGIKQGSRTASARDDSTLTDEVTLLACELLLVER